MLKYAVALATLLGSLAAPQTTAPSIRVDAAQIYRDVETLSADDMEGRLPGSPGGADARAYVLRRLKQAGVAPQDLLATVSRHIPMASSLRMAVSRAQCSPPRDRKLRTARRSREQANASAFLEPAN